MTYAIQYADGGLHIVGTWASCRAVLNTINLLLQDIHSELICVLLVGV